MIIRNGIVREGIVRQGLAAALALAAALVLAACVGQNIAPPYEGGLAEEPTSLTPYQDEDAGIDLMLPAGWEAKALAAGAPDELKAQFEKADANAVMQVYCQGAFVSRTALPIQPLKQVDAATVSNQRLWPRHSMGGGNFDPEFSAWTGMVDAGGQQVPMNFYIAWMLSSRFGGCKYGIFTVVARQNAAQVEGDFLAVVRSLK